MNIFVMPPTSQALFYVLNIHKSNLKMTLQVSAIFIHTIVEEG